ncbi:tetratricopeptide repeat protein 29 [Puma concolor]|uniref:Tetratricopeptide repeat protein 29 n=1 Tax=Puma concolor TaxID=9696 RepID=A0A6P6HQA9_PUMCO|nr:tetratricopeptide repeat protein 29 [Puma concolor]
MTTLPPLPMTHPKLTSLARQKLPCFPSTIPRSQLIKEKDDIDHYLEVNVKGLSKEEVAAYRNSYKKNICVDMLRDGYHKSFTELFALMEKWDALQEAARVRSLFWLQRPLEEQPDKLGHFYHHLTRAEAAERKEELLKKGVVLIGLPSSGPRILSTVSSMCRLQFARGRKAPGAESCCEDTLEWLPLSPDISSNGSHSLASLKAGHNTTSRLFPLQSWSSIYFQSSDLLPEGRVNFCTPKYIPPADVHPKSLLNLRSKLGELLSQLTSSSSLEIRQLLEAAEHYEAFHQLTQGRIWKDETGRFLNLLACESLLRTYRLLSDKMLENKEYKQAIRILIKASEIAKEGSDKKMEGEASYYLGLAHLAAEEYETALTVLNTYSKISIDLEDDLSLGRAYEAIAKVLQSQGKMPEAIKYLKKVVEIARNNFQSLDVVRASTMLGDIYNEKGYYNKASEYFQQAFDTTAELRNMRHVDETKVHYGIAKAHQIMLTVNNYIESDDLTSLDYLLSWKENRSSIAPHPIIGGSRKPTMESLYQIPENSEELNGFPDNRKNET